ncbi:MAG: hypothetical protein NTX67_01795 [Burkholderiales bacterium]|nr:hypothetical protein [Burkholderiales bacterium]
MLKNIKTVLTACTVTFLTACGGGGGDSGGSVSNPPQSTDKISGVTLNPASAIQSAYTAVGNTSDSTYKYQFSQSNPETIGGNTYQVQTIIRVAADGNTSTVKRYYTLNPFKIYTPPYTYSEAPVNGIILQNTTVTLSLGVLPTSAKVGDFGQYETSSSAVCDTLGAKTCVTVAGSSSWTLDKVSDTLAQLCYGALNNPRATPRTCVNLNANSQIE